MCAGQGAIVTNGKCLPPFSRARIYKLLRYPSVKDVRCVPHPLQFLLASPRIHIPLGLSWLSFLAADRLNRSPPLSTAERPVAWPIPPHASCVVRTRCPKPSPHRRDYFATSFSNIELFDMQSNTRHDLTRFVSTRPSFKDCSQEGLSESPRFRHGNEKSEAGELNDERNRSITNVSAMRFAASITKHAFASDFITSSSHRFPVTHANESDRITGLLECRVLPYEGTHAASRITL